ncbi:MAG: regulatory protein RecX [Erythrobacter sp.]|uniref:regulatory protein RecX n=1 Tax=Erythrobacter sp. TaxID=1042 RepID=UPI00329925C5
MTSEGSKTSPQTSGNAQFSAENGSERAGAKGVRKRKKVRPLDETSLRDLALSYCARFATTGAKLEGYLARKLRERGVAEDGEGRVQTPDVPALVARLIELGYVDDGAYARSKTRDLTARGYGARRVEQALWAAGVDEHTREETAPNEAETRRAAILLAKKRRFGPFARHIDEDVSEQAAHKRRDKQVAAMLRAGHKFDHIAFILDAREEGDIDEWLIEAEEEAREEEGPNSW